VASHRVALLKAYVPGAAETIATAFLEHGGFEAQRDDILDACVNALCAAHIHECQTLGNPSEVDEKGLPMEMVYWPASASG